MKTGNKIVTFDVNSQEMKSRELVRRVNKEAGWVEIRQTGSHKIFQDPKTGKTVSVPFHGSKEVPTGTANAILKIVGLK